MTLLLNIKVLKICKGKSIIEKSAQDYYDSDRSIETKRQCVSFAMCAADEAALQVHL